MGEGRAFLWIPPSCGQVRAVVVGQNNMLEQGMLEHPALRATLAELGIAEVFIAPPFDNVFRFDHGAGERFETMMRDLAEESGYEEIASAPVVPLGHSACASFPWNFAAWNPGRTLAILSIKGDAPQTDLTGSGKPNPEWGNRSIDGIPGLMVMSEFEWWDARLEPALRFRATHAGAPIMLLADVGHGHFDATDSLVNELARFIRKAAVARLPALAATTAQDSTRGARLVAVDPVRGWLMDRWRGEAPLRAAAAPATQYTGERAEASWCFDGEMARDVEALYATSRGKKIQQVDFVQAGQLAPIATTHAGVELKAALESDGITFHLGGEFITPLPPKEPVAAKDKPPVPRVITPVMAPIGTHASGTVRILCITGPVTQVAPETFRVQLNRASPMNSGRGSDVWLLAEHPGDSEYKSAVQQAVVHLPLAATGAAQHISFAPIGAQRIGVGAVKLVAKSDSGLPVGFYVREGPAEIDGETLRFTALPARARLPIKVTVVAWQLGRSTAPAVKRASAVEQTFFVTR